MAVTIRVLTCSATPSPMLTSAGAAVNTEMVGPANKCLNADGTTGYVVGINAYLVADSDTSGSGSSGTSQTQVAQNWQELGNMSIQDAQVISGYIGLLWAGVWGIKQIARSFNISERDQDE